jgi:hypothetical protein
MASRFLEKRLELLCGSVFESADINVKGMPAALARSTAEKAIYSSIEGTVSQDGYLH